MCVLANKNFALTFLALLLSACASHVFGADDGFQSAKLPVSLPASGIACGGMVKGEVQYCAGATEYCHSEIKDVCGAEDTLGVCREKPQMCTMDYSPVCGCDGNIYPNECAANAEGISAATKGVCK